LSHTLTLHALPLLTLLSLLDLHSLSHALLSIALSLLTLHALSLLTLHALSQGHAGHTRWHGRSLPL
jgi:hypothetical protein